MKYNITTSKLRFFSGPLFFCRFLFSFHTCFPGAMDKLPSSIRTHASMAGRPAARGGAYILSITYFISLRYANN